MQTQEELLEPFLQWKEAVQGAQMPVDDTTDLYNILYAIRDGRYQTEGGDNPEQFIPADVGNLAAHIINQSLMILMQDDPHLSQILTDTDPAMFVMPDPNNEDVLVAYLVLTELPRTEEQAQSPEWVGDWVPMMTYQYEHALQIPDEVPDIMVTGLVMEAMDVAVMLWDEITSG